MGAGRSFSAGSRRTTNTYQSVTGARDAVGLAKRWVIGSIAVR